MLTNLLSRIRGNQLHVAIFRNAGISLGVRASSMGLAFLLQVILARQLGAFEFGIYTYVWAWLLIVVVIGKMGLDIASIRFVATYRHEGQYGSLRGYIRRVMQLALIASVGIALLFGLVIAVLTRTDWLADWLSDEVITSTQIMLLLIPVYSLLLVQTGILRGADRIAEALITQNLLFQAGILFLFLAGRFFWDLEPNAQLVLWLSLVSGFFVVLLQQFLILRHIIWPIRQTQPDFSTRSWARAAIVIMFNTGLYQIFAQADTIVVGTFLGASAAGIYSIAVRLIRLVNIGLEIAGQATSHLFAPLHARNDRQQLSSAILLNAKIALLYTTAAALVLLLWAEPILSLFGPAYTAAAPVLYILLGGAWLAAATGPNGTVLQMTGYQRDLLVILSLAFVIYVALLGLLVQEGGMLGVALAAALAVTIQNVASSIWVWKRLHIVPTALRITAWR